MVNQFWASRRIVSPNSGHACPDDERNNHGEGDNQTLNINQTSNSHFIAPQGMLQRPQNRLVSLNNFSLGRYQENNVVDPRTEPMVPFSFSDNNTTSTRVVSHNSGRTRPGGEHHNQLEGNYQISILHQSSNFIFRTSQGMLQRPQNHHLSLNNFSLGRYQENNVIDARTEPMVPFSFSDNNMMSSREVSLSNGRTRLGGECHNQLEGNYQMSILRQSSNIFFRTPQGMLQRPQSHHASLDNYSLGRYQENNDVYARTQPMVPFSFSDNNTMSLREASLTNGHTRPGGEHHNQWEGDYQIHIFHQSSNISLRTPQGILQRPQNQKMSLNNLTQGRYHENNVVSYRTPSMTPFSFSNNNTSRILSSGLPSDSLPHANSVQNSSFNGDGFQDHANNFRNHSRPFFHNRRNFRYLPYGEGSSHMNNSLMLNNFNARRLSVDLNSLNGANNDAMPITAPSSSNANGDLARDSAPENDMDNLDLSLHL